MKNLNIKFNIILTLFSANLISSKSLKNVTSTTQNSTSTSNLVTPTTDPPYVFEGVGFKTWDDEEVIGKVDLATSIQNISTCIPMECPLSKFFDIDLCRCVSFHEPSCPPPFVYDHVICACICDRGRLECPNKFVWNEHECRCICPKSEICQRGLVWSDIECDCVCNTKKDCMRNFIFSNETCDCVCDPKRVEAGCPVGSTFDHTLCHCVNDIKPSCPYGFIYDELACDCVCETILDCELEGYFDPNMCICMPIEINEVNFRPTLTTTLRTTTKPKTTSTKSTTSS